MTGAEWAEDQVPSQDWRSHAAELLTIAERCDSMCLQAGRQLGDAVPGLLDLSSQLVSIAAMIDDETVAEATQGLVSVTHTLTQIGDTLTQEKDAIAALIVRNRDLSAGIEDLADKIRFLSAVVSNVKIELASIDKDDMRLKGFGETLKGLAASSQKTLRAFQEAHEKLTLQLKRTSSAQSSFEASHRTKIKTASGEITRSLDALSERRNSVAIIAGQVGGITHQIGMQIAQSVASLQIGDSTRQRLEHVAKAVALAADISDGIDDGGLLGIEVGQQGAARREGIVRLICGLQYLLTAQSQTEYADEIATVDSLLRQVMQASVELLAQSSELTSSPGNATRSFLSELAQKITVATDLIKECGQSRKLVDETASSVVSTIAELEGLAVQVAEMAMDMTIIGTNAVVTSHCLGKKGIALSVIAQHLRSHALRVTDAAVQIKPALAKVLTSAEHFSAIREGQDAASIDHLTTRMAQSLQAFENSDKAIIDIQQDLDVRVSAVGQVLRQAIGALEETDVIAVNLETIVTTLEESGRDADCLPSDADNIIDQHLRPCYTMAAERVIHDDYFSRIAAAAPDDLAA